MTEQECINKAIQLAAKSSEPVGCGVVIVQDGRVIAEAFNSQRTDNIAVNHAEIKAVSLANKKTGSRKLTNSVAYCSCEPCAMCLAALSYANVSRIVFHYHMKDLFPNDRQSKLDPYEFVKTLNFIPKLEQI